MTYPRPISDIIKEIGDSFHSSFQANLEYKSLVKAKLNALVYNQDDYLYFQHTHELYPNVCILAY